MSTRFECWRCRRSFANLALLLTHLQAHGGVPPTVRRTK
jgi:hypothetical protein